MMADQKRRYSSDIHTRGYYRQSAERDLAWAQVFTFVVGAMLGAAITLGWMA